MRRIGRFVQFVATMCAAISLMASPAAADQTWDDPERSSERAESEPDEDAGFNGDESKKIDEPEESTGAFESEEPGEVYRSAFHPGTMAMQLIMGAGLGVATAGTGMGLMGLGLGLEAKYDGSLMMLVALPLIFVTMAVGAIPLGLSPVATHAGVFLGGGDFWDRQSTHLGGTLIGGILGGAAGIFGSVQLYQHQDLQWRNDPFLAGLLISLPYIGGMTLGAIVGYHIHHRRFLQKERERRSRKLETPRLQPTIGTPMSADDTGWTFGATFRF